MKTLNLLQHLRAQTAYYTIFLGLLSFNGMLQAQEVNAQQAVVKTSSYLCALPENEYRGSGLLFKHEDLNYVLTSEHVILWGKSGYCHSALTQDGERISLELAHADWATGLALFKVKSRITMSSLPQLTDFTKVVRAQDRVTTIGFPWTEQSIRRDDAGHILSAESERYFLANTQTAIELADSHGEFGMSGSPVLDESGAKIYGILSHQYLKINSGGQTTVAEFDADDNGSSLNKLLVIPSKAVVSWLNRYFAQSDEPVSSFVKEASDQQARIQRVYADGLTWTATNVVDGPCAPSPNLTLPIAFGRSPLTFFGDPVGIGGDVQSYGSAVEIEVSFDRNPSGHLTATEWYLPSRSDWLRSLKDVLYRPGKVAVTGFIHRNPDTGSVQRMCVHSLEEFFRKLTSPNVSPISVITSSISTGPIEDSLKVIANNAAQLTSLVQQFKSREISLNTGRWLSRMLLEAEAASDPLQWELVPVDRFRGYRSFDLYRDFWIELDTKDNFASIEIRKVLINIDNTLGKMKL